LQLRLWNLNICIKKVDAKCGDYISNDVISLARVFQCLHSRSFPLGANWPKSDSSVDGELRGNWRWSSNSRDVVASSPSYSRPAARAPQRACLQAKWRVTMLRHGEEDAPGRGKRNIRTNHELVRNLVIGLELKLVVCPIFIFLFATLELRESRVNFREDFWDCY